MSSRYGPFLINYDQVEGTDTPDLMVYDIARSVADYLDIHENAGLLLQVRVDLSVNVDHGLIGEDIDDAQLLEDTGSALLAAADIELGSKAQISLTGVAPDLSEAEKEDVSGNSGAITSVYLVWID